MMNATEDELRAALGRQADKVRSGLTLAEIRDQGMRAHRHRPRLLAPALAAAAVALVVLAVSVLGRGGDRTVPPLAPPTGVTAPVSTVVTSVVTTRGTSADTTGGTPPRSTPGTTPSNGSPTATSSASTIGTSAADPTTGPELTSTEVVTTP